MRRCEGLEGVQGRRGESSSGDVAEECCGSSVRRDWLLEEVLASLWIHRDNNLWVRLVTIEPYH